MHELNITPDPRIAGSLAYVRRPVAPLPESRSSLIYLVGCGRFVKIGVGKDLARRVMMLQIGCPIELALLASFHSSTPNQHERELHHRFERYWVRGEWFDLPHATFNDFLADVAKREQGSITLAGEKHLRGLALFIGQG